MLIYEALMNDSNKIIITAKIMIITIITIQKNIVNYLIERNTTAFENRVPGNCLV